MTRLRIDLPEDVTEKLAAQATRAGHASVEEYIESLLRAEAVEAAEDLYGPPQLTFSSEEELEAILVRRIDDVDGSIEATPEFWQQLKRAAADRRQTGR
jgi:hypothetical protein